jgi:phenylpropionate dioxygenase-like ring-hydroxylating dioxygenase large terminal subunit
VPIGISGNAEYFGLEWRDREKLSLTPVEVTKLGGLVFARLEAGGPDIAASLGAFATPLAEAGLRFREPFDKGNQIWQANWKIAVESAIEGYHVGPVHPQSFAPLVGATGPSSFTGQHSLAPSELSAAGQGSIARYAERLGLACGPRTDAYEHLHIFPNMMAIISGGTVFGMQIYRPVDAVTTRLHYWGALGASAKPAQRHGAPGRAVEQQLIAFNHLVLGEDRAISELVQQGRVQAQRPAQLGAGEDRIAAFHRAWRQAMTAVPQTRGATR